MNEQNALIGMMILGGSCGNLVAIALEDAGLFVGLLVGAAASVLSGLALIMYMVEADTNEKKTNAGKGSKFEDSGEEHHTEEDDGSPKKLDTWLLNKIIFGSAMDGLGSAGPPMMFQIVFYSTYYMIPLLALKETYVSATEF